MKRLFVVSNLFICILISLSGCQADSAALIKGKQTPAFELQSITDNLLRFPNHYDGKVVVIRFWADWCPFCESEMKNIEPIYKKYKQKGLVILALNVRQDRDTAAAFIEKLGVSYPVLLDKDGVTARKYGVIGLPTTFFIDRQGKLHTRIIGESTAELFEQIIGELL